MTDGSWNTRTLGQLEALLLRLWMVKADREKARTPKM